MLSKKDLLLKDICSEFPIDTSKAHFKALYPFCNELGYSEIIKSLRKMQAKTTDKIRVVLLFGESNVLSLLPTLAEIADLLLLADINPFQYAHINYLLQCLKDTDSPSAFYTTYLKNTPCLDQQVPNTKFVYSEPEFDYLMKNAQSSVGKYYFLNNQENFTVCKEALNKILYGQIYFNLVDANACNKLNARLAQYNATFILCNFTNIHNYVDGRMLTTSVQLLLQNNENILIVFSTGFKRDLRAIYTNNLAYYLAIGEKHYCANYDAFLIQKYMQKEHMQQYIRACGFFSKKPKKTKAVKLLVFCYVAFACDKALVIDIIEGKVDINQHSFSLHAHDTIEEVTQFVLAKKLEHKSFKKGNFSFFDFVSNDYWIFKIRGSKEKINPLLKYRDEDTVYHNPHDVYAARFKLTSRIVEVKHSVKALIIQKTADGGQLKRA